MLLFILLSLFGIQVFSKTECSPGSHNCDPECMKCCQTKCSSDSTVQSGGSCSSYSIPASVTCPALTTKIYADTTTRVNGDDSQNYDDVIFCLVTNCEKFSGTDCTVCSTCKAEFTLCSGKCRTKVDTTLDPASCPVSQFVSGVGISSASVTFTGPTGVGDCGGVAVPSCNQTTFATSTKAYYVQCKAMDAETGDKSMAACPVFTVTVDSKNPTITCPSVVSVTPTSNTVNAVATYSISASDDLTSSPVITCNYNSGYSFPPGNTTVTCTAKDLANNQASCSFKVVNTDTTKPTIICPSNYVGTPFSGAASIVLTGYTPTLTATDGSGIASASCTPTASVATPYTFFIGVTTVICTARDNSGLTNSCNFTVTVVDNVPPVISCPSSFIYTTQASDNRPDVLVSFRSAVNATDASGIRNISCPGSNSTRFMVSLSTPTVCFATDNAGLVSNCTLYVNVIDSTPPTLNCPANLTVSPTSYKSAQANATFAIPVASDFSGIRNATSCSATSPASVGLGITTITCQATDNAGKTSMCEFSVNNTDNTKPVVSCPALPGTTTYVTPTNGNDVYYVLSWYFNALDNSGISSLSCVTASGIEIPMNNSIYTYLFLYGTTNITCTATDNAGNKNSTCKGTVVVYDNIPPTIKCPANINVKPSGGSTAAASWILNATDGSGINRTFCSQQSGTQFSLGSTLVICTAFDKLQNSNTCNFTVTVSENSAPTITCPASATAFTSGNTPSGTASYLVTASDSTDGSLIAVCSPSSPSTFPLGFSTVTCTATNSFKLQTSCSISVEIKDITPPSITCPSNIVKLPDAGQPYASVTFSVSSSDNSGIKSTTCDYISGYQFPGSTNTTVTCTAIDNAILSKTCSFVVSVLDIVPPLISCPTDISISPLNGATSTLVDYPLPTSTDNVAIKSSNCSKSTGSNFPLGKTTVTCIAIDTSNNQASCSFVVFIGDVTPPVITCPESVSIFTSMGVNTGLYNWKLATATDNSGSATVTCAQFGVQTTFSVGTTSLLCNAVDTAGNSASCFFTVTVTDNEPPYVPCPDDITDVLGSGKNSKTVAWEFSPSDNVGIATSSCSLDSGTSFGFGTTTVTCKATDYSGSSASCSFTVMIEDSQPPIVTCPAAYIGSTSPGSTFGTVIWNAPSEADHSVYDNVGVSFVSCTLDLTDTVFPLGQTMVICTGFDLAGNTASCQFAVTIQDAETPNITCPESLSFVIPLGDSSTSAYLPFHALVSPTDNVGVVRKSLYRAGTQLDFANDFRTVNVGRTFFTYTAEDEAGNFASCTFTGTVTKDGANLDLEPPVIVCPTSTNLTFTNDPDKDYAIASWTEATATDNVGTPSVQPYTTPTAGLYRGAAFPVGSTRVRYVATDGSGNTAECSFTVIVKDTQAPRVICPNSFVQKCPAPFKYANVSWLPPTFSDNVALLATSVSRTSGTYTAGTYSVDASAVDTSGNTASCTFTFSILTDTTPPTVTCPPSKLVSTGKDAANAIVSWSPPTIYDASGIRSAVYTPAQFFPPASFSLGATVIKYTVTDQYNNSNSCSFKITVVDNQIPTINCPASFELQVLSGDTIFVSWQQPDAHDNVNIDKVTQTYSPDILYTPGTYIVVAQANDTSGNVAVPCRFNFTVKAAAQATSAASSSAAAAAAGGAAGGLILIGLIIAAIWTRRQREKLRKLESQYGNVDMSDEAVLARAQAIQQALLNKKRTASPNMKWLQIPAISFQSPPTTLADMLRFLSQFADYEIPRASITIESEIGAGEFGSVCSGYVKKADLTKLTIAIKTLKDNSSATRKLKFLQEASIMIQFKHPKIVSLIGVVTKSEPALICLEFCELGSLRSYLRSELVFEKIPDSDLVRMACDVCSAMHYLAASGFVHRDLAARNILVNKDFICKVCDFGLSQESNGAQANVQDEKIPIRWTAPEAVQFGKFSPDSDVWSFGVLLWEMWSYGAMPYKGMSNEVVMQQVQKGYRMPNPKNCPTYMHALMLECWQAEAGDRPGFQDVFERLLAAWNICKPIGHYSKTSHLVTHKATSVKAHVVTLANPNNDDDADTYDLGGDGGKIKKPVIASSTDPDNDEDPDLYDMGGDGGKIKAEKIPIASATTDDDDDGMYDMGGDGGRVKAEKIEIVTSTEREDDDNDADMYDMGGDGGKVKAEKPEIVDFNEEVHMEAANIDPDDADLAHFGFSDANTEPDFEKPTGYLEVEGAETRSPHETIQNQSYEERVLPSNRTERNQSYEEAAEYTVPTSQPDELAAPDHQYDVPNGEQNSAYYQAASLTQEYSEPDATPNEYLQPSVEYSHASDQYQFPESSDSSQLNTYETPITSNPEYLSPQQDDGYEVPQDELATDRV